MFASTIFTSFIAAAFFTLAEAHGAVSKIEVAGQTFNSPLINAAGDTGPFYVPSSNSPVTDVTSNSMFCGTVGNKATSTPSIDLSQGNSISFYWNSGYSAGTTWPHNTGPMFLYIAKCDGDCSSMTASNTNFIKVEQQGMVNGQWVQADLKAGQPATFTLPSDLASGKYLMRHEVINLASTDENYPACSQFDITGGSNDYSSAETAKFPGAYSATDAGLTVAGSAVYSIKSDAAYVFPGPKPINPTDGSSSSSGSSASASSGSASASSGSASASAGSSGASVSIGSSALSSNVTVSPTSVLAVSASIHLPTPSAASSIATTGTGTGAATSGSTASAGSSSSSSSTSSTITTSAAAGGQGTNYESCTTAWTACNSAYMSATASASTTGIAVSTAYTCQTDFESCMGGASSTPSVNSRAFGKHLRRHHAGMSRMEFH